MGRWLLFVVPLAVLAVGAWQHRWMSDDGFIDLRVVRMIVSGHGPVFNIGQRVEANTSPLWVFVLAVEDVVLPIRLEWIAVLTGMLLTLGGIAACMAAASELWTDEHHDRLLVPVGALVVAAVPAMWDYASSGLETGLTFAWIGSSAWCLARWSHSETPRIATTTLVIIGLGPLVRPDLVVVSIVFVVVLLIGARPAGLRAWIRVASLLAALPVAYEIFRMGYYGALVPNTYFAKEGGRAWWGQGWRYLSDFVGTYWLWLPLIVLAAMLVLLVRQQRHHQNRREHLVIAGLPLAGLLYATAIVRVGGDFMHARLLLPAFVLLLAPVAVIPLNRTNAFALFVVPWAAIAIIGMRPKAVDLNAGINDLRAFSVTVSGRANPVTDVDWGYGRGGRYAIRTDPLHRVYYSATGPVDVAGHALAPVAGQRRPVVVAFAIGALGYSLGPGYTVLDALGLADPIDARFAIGHRGRRPGHEKVMPQAWIWARVANGDQTPDPSAFPVGKVYVADRAPTLLAQPNGVSYASMVNAARAALNCPAVRHLQQASTDALTPARFLENALHSVTDFRVRIPANPLDAQHC